MRKITTVLGVPFDALTIKEAVKNVMVFFADGGQHIVCTPNPEIVMEAQRDKDLMGILKAADMVVPDGVGIVWASKYSERRLHERVAGYDLVLGLFQKMKEVEGTVYFFGAAPGIAAAAAKNMMKEYPGLRVIGTRNGYFNSKDEKEIIEEIKRLSPSLLLVGLGSPKQEKWIYDNMRFTNAKVSIGIGGCFDVMAGKVQRAPGIWQKLGLEWFHRLIKEPRRIKRMLRLPVFVLEVRKARMSKIKKAK